MIEEAHKIIRDTIRKQTGSMKTPAQIDRALNRALFDYMIFLLKSNNNPQDIKRYIERVDADNGVPENMVREISISSEVDESEYEGEILSEKEFNDRRNSVLLAPEYTNPIARISGKEIEVLPVNGNYILTYYREPIECRYAYTVAENGRDIIFDPDNSIDLDCNKLAMSEVISRALLYLGISLENQSLVMEERIKDGN